MGQEIATGHGRLGGDIRSMRRLRGVTLADLARRAARSIGWMSQVERGLTEPGIAELRRIAAEFSVPVSFFFRNEAAPAGERGAIVRASARATLGSSASGLTEELLSPDLSGDFEMIRSVFSPGARSEDVPARPTQEGGYIVAGRLDLTLGGVCHRLEPGDSFQFRNRNYRWRNPGEVPCVALWVVSPPSY